MDRLPVDTNKVVTQIQHRIWPCVPHLPGVDCVVAQEAYLRSRGALKPAQKKDFNAPGNR